MCHVHIQVQNQNQGCAHFKIMIKDVPASCLNQASQFKGCAHFNIVIKDVPHTITTSQHHQYVPGANHAVLP